MCVKYIIIIMSVAVSTCDTSATMPQFHIDTEEVSAMNTDTKVSAQTREKAMLDAREKFNPDTLCRDYDMSQEDFLKCEDLVKSMHDAQDIYQLKDAMLQLMAKVNPYAGDKSFSNDRLHQSLVRFIEEYDLTRVRSMR